MSGGPAGPTPDCPMSPNHIAALASLIWETEGRPLGRDREFWLQAEALLRAHGPEGGVVALDEV